MFFWICTKISKKRQLWRFLDQICKHQKPHSSFFAWGGNSSGGKKLQLAWRNICSLAKKNHFWQGRYKGLWCDLIIMPPCIVYCALQYMYSGFICQLQWMVKLVHTVESIQYFDIRLLAFWILKVHLWPMMKNDFLAF